MSMKPPAFFLSSSSASRWRHLSGATIACWAVMVSMNIGMPAGAFDIVIDPGHGGEDPGALGCDDLEEAEINLDVGLRLKDLLEESGQTVFMTRTTDTFVELYARADFANSQGATRFASLHANAFSDPSATGTETFCHTSEAPAAVDMRDQIQFEMVESWGLRDRGGKTANFVVLSQTTMPATLSELGFVTNCEIDALLLSSSTRRQDAADAHLRALAEHLGFDAASGGVDDDGDLKGVVFADQGVGTNDMSQRIPGATVSLVGRNEVVVASGESAAWSFTLPPGTYTVIAEAEGFLAGERTCTLAAGAVQFCSIGLFPDAGEGEGEAPSEGEGEPGGEGEGEGEPGGEGEGEGEPGGEGEGEGEPGSVPLQRIVIRNQVHADGGCSSGGHGHVFASVLAGLMVLRRRRWRRPACGAVLVFGSWAAHAGQGSVVPTKDSSTEGRSWAAISVSSGTKVSPLPARSPLATRLVRRGGASSTMPSPSGHALLLSDGRYDGLVVVELASGLETALSVGQRAGFRALWTDDEHVAHRVPQKPFGGLPLVELSAKTGSFVGPVVEHPQFVIAQTPAGAVLLGERADDQGGMLAPQRLSPQDDQCFAPLLRGNIVVFQCLGSGVWVRRLSDHAAFSLGAGAQLSLAHDGKAFAYVVSRDEGHIAIASDVVVVDMSGPVPLPVVWVTPGLERAPGVSNERSDGSRLISFVDDAGIAVAPVAWPLSDKDRP
jgi:N-acetylmuramoyl-L-alanine amidase